MADNLVLIVDPVILPFVDLSPPPLVPSWLETLITMIDSGPRPRLLYERQPPCDVSSSREQDISPRGFKLAPALDVYLSHVHSSLKSEKGGQLCFVISASQNLDENFAAEATRLRTLRPSLYGVYIDFGGYLSESVGEDGWIDLADYLITYPGQANKYGRSICSRFLLGFQNAKRGFICMLSRATIRMSQPI